MERILMVEDEANIAEATSAYMREFGYDVRIAPSGEEALSVFDAFAPSLVVLDLMLPGMGGHDVCRAIRAKSRVPIIMLTARTEEEDVISGLDIGADDYMAKPFRPRELVWRIKSVLRRSSQGLLAARMSWRGGDLEADFGARTVRKSGAVVALTPQEYRLFAALAAHAGHVLSRDALISEAFEECFGGYDRTVDSHIKNLRAKIDTHGHQYIVTVRGSGYRFDGGQ